MDTQLQNKLLRLNLLDTTKLSQRALDYAIKGYRLGSPELCRYVRRGDSQLSELRRRMTDLYPKLMMQQPSLASQSIGESAAPSEVRFPFAALRISSALHAICTAATEISTFTMLLLEDARVPVTAAVDKVCLLINRQMSLCIVALFKKEASCAEMVLQARGSRQLFDQAFHELRGDLRRRVAMPAALGMAIINTLIQIAGQIQEIAQAILFWLKGGRLGESPEVEKTQHFRLSSPITS